MAMKRRIGRMKGMKKGRLSTTMNTPLRVKGATPKGTRKY
jgi:hypothetical protein